MSDSQLPQPHAGKFAASDLTREPLGGPDGEVRVLVAGASGFIGSHLCRYLRAHGAQVHRLVRREPRSADEISWDPAAGVLAAEQLEGYGTVYNLSGTPVGDHRWTRARKRELREVRVNCTSLLANTLAALSSTPEAFISASAIGYYGEFYDDREFREGDPPGDSFLAQLAVDWEAAAQPAAAAGIRLVLTRTGVVLGPGGGALAKMLPLFRKGLGGVVGSGKQLVSWIGLTDTVRALAWLANQPEVSGPVNLVSPEAVDNLDFTQLLASQIGKPAMLPVPALAVKAALGEMGEALALKGARVLPQVLLAHGFEFAYPDLADALKHEFQLHRQMQSIKG